jgi:hypothetical protein
MVLTEAAGTQPPMSPPRDRALTADGVKSTRSICRRMPCPRAPGTHSSLPGSRGPAAETRLGRRTWTRRPRPPAEQRSWATGSGGSQDGRIAVAGGRRTTAAQQQQQQQRGCGRRVASRLAGRGRETRTGVDEVARDQERQHGDAARIWWWWAGARRWADNVIGGLGLWRSTGRPQRAAAAACGGGAAVRVFSAQG